MSAFRIRHGEQEFVAHTEGNGAVRIGDSDEPVRIVQTGERTYLLMHGGSMVTAVAARVGNRWHVVIRGRLIELETQSERERLISSLSLSGVHAQSVLEVRAPMPSRIVRIDVNVGDEVTVGQGLIVLEAMKMENTLKASQNGTVTHVAVMPGKAVEKGALLIVLK
jgi:acetyl/propionyl-CoA carboxylase alpha subunit